MDKTLKIFKAEIKSIDVDKKRAIVVVSTDKKDGDGDIVMPDSFRKGMKRYNDHPILLSSHNYYDLTKQIGMAHKIKINDKDVEADFEWFTGQGNPEADWGWFLAQKGIAAFSIGFQGKAFDWIEEKDDSGNKRITGRKFTEIELLEISQVLVPSNPGALQNSINNQNTPVEAKEMAELVLKGMKDGKIIYQENIDKKTQKDDSMNSNHETRICAMEKCMAQMQENHTAMSAKIEALELRDTEGANIDDNDPTKSKKKHYSKDLLAPDGNDHIPEAKGKSILDAIKEAFK